MEDYILLPEDRRWAEERIAVLEQKIKDLGPEFHEVLNQSSETWHDNAPFDAVVEKQHLLVAEKTHLREILSKASLVVPKPKKDTVGIGSIILLEGKRGEQKIRIAGDWTHQSGKTISETMTVSRRSPLAQAMIGKKAGETTSFGTVRHIQNNS